MSEFAFFIQGKPAPGGSKTVFPLWRSNGSLVTEVRKGRVWPILRVVDDAGEGNKIWKAAVTIQARSFMRGAKPFEEPMKVEFVFYLKRPQKHYRTGKHAHMLRDDAPEYHTKRPDALKFARSTEDALTGVVWADDAQNVRLCTEKRYCGPEDKEGCSVRIILLDSKPKSQE
jgi:Holliday junction resolvase RusA-like endonuclease